MAISAEQFNIFNRQIQARIVRVFQLDHFVIRADRRNDFQPLIPSDPMFHMDHQITGGQALGFGQEILGATFLTGSPDQTVAQNILF